MALVKRIFSHGNAMDILNSIAPDFPHDDLNLRLKSAIIRPPPIDRHPFRHLAANAHLLSPQRAQHLALKHLPLPYTAKQCSIA